MQKWDPNFNPTYQKNTNAKVWASLGDLPWTYWHPSILSDLVCRIGVPLRIDNSTLLGNFGHFACFLIDFDLSGALHDTLAF